MVYEDQMGREVTIDRIPSRIISLVPSITELLFDLGLESKLVGVTKFCSRPTQASKIEKVGGTKNFNFEAINKLKPDLILCNKEENYKEGVEKLMVDYPVWVSVVDDLVDCLEMIKSIGDLTDSGKKVNNLIDEIRYNFSNRVVNFNKSAIYLIWRKPYMVAANDTFINNILKECGIRNIVNGSVRYPEVDLITLSETPDLVLLSSEPYPFSQKHIDEFKNLFPNSDVLLVDGEMFSWFGSRMIHAPEYFSKLYQYYCANNTK